jgi:hypothetical protein
VAAQLPRFAAIPRLVAFANAVLDETCERVVAVTTKQSSRRQAQDEQFPLRLNKQTVAADRHQKVTNYLSEPYWV